MTTMLSRYRGPNTYRTKAKQSTQISPIHLTIHFNGQMMMMKTMKMTEAASDVDDKSGKIDVGMCINRNTTVGGEKHC